MADVTISQLSQGIPNKNSAEIPYSDGTTTLKTSPSGIVAASPGTVIQSVYGKDNTNYYFPDPGNSAPINLTSSINFIKKFASSRVQITVTGYVLAYNGTGAPGAGFYLLYNNEPLDNSITPYLAVNGFNGISSVSTSLNILYEHITNETNLNYRLAITKNSQQGTGNLYQISSYWIIQEIAG